MVPDSAHPVRDRLIAFLRHDNLVLAVLAVVIGVIVGWAIVGFRELINLVQAISYGSGGENLATIAGNLPAWQVIAAPTVGGIFIGLFYRYLMPGGAPQGPAHVIQASALRGGRLPLWPGLMATVGSAASIGVGASVGREGPVVRQRGSCSGVAPPPLYRRRSTPPLPAPYSPMK